MPRRSRDRRRAVAVAAATAALGVAWGCGSAGDAGEAGEVRTEVVTSATPTTGTAPGADGVAIASAGADGPGADREARDLAPERFRTAVVCLLEAERRARGLGGLRRDAALRRAAEAHVRDMAEEGYFAHRSPDGTTPGDRARAAGYEPRPGEVWLVGENLAYATSGLSSPRRLVAGWMRSEGHRENILRRGFDEIGVGLAFGAPGGRRPPGTLAATEFGAR